ncbi:VWA domain-containing protein [Ruminococcus sp.]|uniref:vWA domain-containing protein n=1 Tax=Ruminococcus sp. TaxID=41978 RepID=UPI00258DC04E|nr:VWA domain-containing protein [Ruminococcus sp.]MCR5020699.1 VWA domain-containing protein [Ruminococcus sp.]
MKINHSKPTADDFVKSLDRSIRKKRITLVTLLGVLAAVVVVIALVGMSISRNNRINTAKNAISQLDIQSTYKEPEFPDNEDWDDDGIMNQLESDSETSVQNADTDGDGLCDGDEIKLGTDPLNPDTDGDEMLDGYEVIAGTSPRLDLTDGSTPDNTRVMVVEKRLNGCKLHLSGNPNIAGASIEKLDLFGISSNPSVVSAAYDFYSEYPCMEATIKISVDESRLRKCGCEFKDLKVMRFDVDSRKYIPLESRSDNKRRYVQATITEPGTYVVGADASVNEAATTRVAFLIDNSGSMYPKELCPTSSENDVDFKRLDFTQSLIDKFDSDFRIGISKFTGTYTRMCGFTDDRTALSDVIKRIRTEDEIFDGTHNQIALKRCIEEFTATGDGKYVNIIVMLSDGESDETNAESIKNLARLANEKSVIVLTVGLGREIDRAWLQEMAYSTGGKYYSASEANALDDVYKQIVTTLNYDIVSYSDSSDTITGYSLYNTGFEPAKNGFSFKNFRTTTSASVDFGMAVMARDWYLGNFRMSLGDISPADPSLQKVDAAGYDLSGTSTAKAYEERKTLSAVSADIFRHRYSRVTDYIDYTSKGDVLQVNNDYRADAENRGWKISKRKFESGNLPWSKVELLSLDIAEGMEKIAKGYNNDDAQLCAALYRLNSLQWDDKDEEFNLTNGDEGFDMLCSQLSLGVPVVTTIDDTHTVNTIALIRDSSCHRKYILRIYDNNYPEKVKELYLEKRPVAHIDIDVKGNITVKEQSFTYVATYEGKRVGVAFSGVEAH